MHLLNVHTRELEEFVDERSAPSYGILSHTWSPHGEITFLDMKTLDDEAIRSRHGYDKVEFVITRANAADLSYAWIDTCCIDKSSSAHLSEAINSMYAYYERSEECWVYLTDLPGSYSMPTPSNPWTLEQEAKFCSLAWFTRGWTLQELLAPRRHRVRFYGFAANFIGTLQDLTDLVHRATNINFRVLANKLRIRDVSVAQRMSWASGRTTTRTEDRAYSLLGIFDINMPMLYGEGVKAFQRLQEEIMRTSTDLSLFAWEYLDDQNVQGTTLLAPSPSNFADCHDMVYYAQRGQRPHRMTNMGLEIELAVEKLQEVAFLNCRSESTEEDDEAEVVCLHLRATDPYGWSQTISTSYTEPFQCQVPAPTTMGGRRLRTRDFSSTRSTATLENLMIMRSIREEDPVAVSRIYFLFRIAETSLTSLGSDNVTLIGQPAHWDRQKLMMTIDNSRGDTHAVVEFATDNCRARTAFRAGAYKTLRGLEIPTLYVCTAQTDAYTVTGHVPMKLPIPHKDVAHQELDYWTRMESWPLVDRKSDWLTVNVETQVYRGQPAVSIELAVSSPNFHQPAYTPAASSGVPLLQEIEDMMSASKNGSSEPSESELSLARNMLAASSFERSALRRYKRRMTRGGNDDDMVVEELATDLREKMLAHETHVDVMKYEMPQARSLIVKKHLRPSSGN